jgi:hypothetical protein
MRKALIPVLLSMWVSGQVFSASLKIKSPGGGESWQLGSEKSIAWEKSGSFSGFDIILYQGSTKVGVIVKNLDPNSTFFLWKKVGEFVGGTAVAGNDYKIRVKGFLSSGMIIIGVSSPFELKPTPQNYWKALLTQPVTMFKMDVLHIISPLNGETWRMGENRTIKWNSFSGAPEKLSIYIIARNLGRSGPIWIARNIENKGSFQWNIPIQLTKSLFQPGKYDMVIQGPTGKDLTKGELNIDNPTTNSLFPSGNSSFKILDNLQWSFTGIGKLGVLTITIEANSGNDFTLFGTTDGSDFGTQWLECRVTCKVPVPPAWNTPPTEKVMVEGLFSVSGNNGSQKFYKAPSYPIIIKKNGNYKLSFKFKEHTRILCYIESAANANVFKGFPVIQGIPKYPESCKNYYFPKLQVVLHTKTSSGWTIPSEKIFYLEYNNVNEAGHTITYFQETRNICGAWVHW